MSRISRACRLAAFLPLAASTGLTGQSTAAASEADVEAVRQAVADYVEALYEVDPTKIERSVSRGLAKIGIGRDDAPTSTIEEDRMTFDELRDTAAEWNADGNVPPSATKEIVVFDVLDRIASAKVTASWGIDYFHLAKYDGRWLIVNVIYQGHPDP
ncbi:MAG: nuclear transport factor 2 family protein [Gemmatimonadota bacterium]|nr:nuclear transport factor 2 family protein [Gemmatimonadota bacterium]